ncbi:glycosyltransferase family 4 protein [soil metagenome]
MPDVSRLANKGDLMDVAFCYPSVLPSRGGCETYIGDLARRLARDGHRVHLVASIWDTTALPAATHYHRIEPVKGPRFLRPWRFAAACEARLKSIQPDVSLGFDKTWGQDILYPQGGLHAATAWHNRLKQTSTAARVASDIGKFFDLANRSYHRLERKQYFESPRPRVVVNSEMVRGHFEQFYGVDPQSIRVLRSAIDPGRFASEDRFKLRDEQRRSWGVNADTSVGLFVAMNYRLKGLEPLIRALPLIAKRTDYRLVVVGHPKFAPYAKLAERLGVSDRVTFLGPRRDPKSAYFAADFLVHPTFYDPCSLVALEALACGLPVITTKFNGAAELLNETNGIVIDTPHDAAALAAGIERMSEPSFRATAAVSARKAANAWTFEDHYRGLMAIMTERQQLRQAA